MQIIVDVEIGVTEKRANEMVELIKKTLDENGFNMCYADIELDY